MRRSILSSFIILIPLFLNSCFNFGSSTRARIKYGGFQGNAEEETTETTLGERADGQILLEASPCVCANNESFVLSDCVSFCSDKSDAQANLYLKASFAKPEDQTFYESIENWCKKDYSDQTEQTQTTNSCSVSLNPGSGIPITKDSITFLGDYLKVQVNDSITQTNNVFVAKIIQNPSGATSTAGQYKPVSDQPDYNTGSLKITPLSMYHCISSAGRVSPPDNIPEIIASFRKHYFYYDSLNPPPLPVTSYFDTCHDSQIYGGTDAVEYPRLGVIPGFLNTWGNSDLRMFDTDGNEVTDINDTLSRRFTDAGITTTNFPFFKAFFPLFPVNAFQDPTNQGGTPPTNIGDPSPLMGHWLIPYFKQGSNQAIFFCPKLSDFNAAGTGVFQILGEYIGTSTEEIYFTVKETETYVDFQGATRFAPSDFLFMPKSRIRDIWFYYQPQPNTSAAEVKAQEKDILTKTLYFHWPVDPAYDPTSGNAPVKIAGAKTYKVSHPEEISAGNGSNSSVPANKVYACAPCTVSEAECQ